jgi:hypothetical protein
MSKQLREANRIAQIALEHHRQDPDEDTEAELDAAMAHRDAAWLAHTVEGQQP